MKRMIVASLFVVCIAAGQAKAADGQFSLFAGYLNPLELNLGNVRTFDFSVTGVYGMRV
jgi:hypothetical protein